MYANLVKAPRGRHRRTYPDDFKTQLVAACLQPGVSMAAVVARHWLVLDGLEIGPIECKRPHITLAT